MKILPPNSDSTNILDIGEHRIIGKELFFNFKDLLGQANILKRHKAYRTLKISTGSLAFSALGKREKIVFPFFAKVVKFRPIDQDQQSFKYRTKRITGLMEKEYPPVLHNT